MSDFWEQRDRRSSISAYNYKIGDEANPEHIDFTKTNQDATHAVKKLDVGDNVFIKRSNGKWSFAVLAVKSTAGDEKVYSFQIGQNHKFKSLREHQLGEYVRLVKSGAKQRRSFSNLDINQSISCESYTDRVVKSTGQKKSRWTGIIDIKSMFDDDDDDDEEDKENISHNNKRHGAARSIAVSDLSMASPVENVLRQRRSLGAAEIENTFDEESKVDVPSVIDTRLRKSPKSYIKTESDEVGSLQSTTKSFSSRAMSAKQRQSSPLAHLNSIEEEGGEEFSILDDLLVSEALLKDDKSKGTPIIKRSPYTRKSVSSARQLPTHAPKRSISNFGASRHSLSAERQSNCQPRSISKDGVRERAVQPQSTIFNAEAWRAKSDPEIVFLPSGDEEDAIESGSNNNNFNTANWKAKSDHEIVFVPSGEEKSDEESKTSNGKIPPTSTSTALVLHPSSKEKDDSTGKSTGGKDCVNEPSKRPSNGKKRRRLKFSGTTFFFKNFRKKDPQPKTKVSSATGSNDEDRKTADQSSPKKSKPSEPKARPNVSQTNHYAQPNPAYASAPCFASNYYTNPSNVYYVTDQRLAQKYRDYAQHVMRAQAAQCSYNPSMCAQFNHQMTQLGQIPTQPSVIRVGTNGITGGGYKMTSIGHGIQIGMPKM